MSEAAVRKWIKNAAWPVSATPPWTGADVARVRMFREVVLNGHRPAEDGPEIAGGLDSKAEFARMSLPRRAQTQLWMERAAQVRQRREIEAGKLHSAAKCQDQRIRQINHVRDMALSWPSSCRDVLANQPAERVEEIMTGLVADLLKAFATEPSKEKI